jgi:hypothetical protein
LHCGHSSATAGSVAKPGGDSDDGGVEAGEDDELEGAGRDP